MPHRPKPPTARVIPEVMSATAEHPAQFDDLVVAGRGGLELLHGLQVSGVDVHVGEDFKAAADGGRVDGGAVPGDDAGVFWPLDPA